MIAGLPYLQRSGTIGRGVVHIVFLGLRDTFDYHHIGGLDSFYRRVAASCVVHGVEVQYVLYGYAVSETHSPTDGVTVIRTCSFRDALEALDSTAGPVVVNAIRRRDRPAFMLFRRSRQRRSFHMVYSLYSESRVRRELYMLESTLLPYNGTALALSPRLAAFAERRRNRAAVFIPPVPDMYFQRPEWESRGQLRVSFIGRIDPRKGVSEFLSIMQALDGRSNLEFSICGYPWPQCDKCMGLHERLLAEVPESYYPADYNNWTPEVERAIVHRLHETDVLVLPYRRLSSSVDTPLLLLEGMAAGCAVISPRLGDIPDVYGESPFVVPANDVVDSAIRLLKETDEELQRERLRVQRRAMAMRLDQSGTFERVKSIVPLH